jgi:peptidoglycan/xylan/chitin deacetylase (PgdA/CDA1 family)
MPKWRYNAIDFYRTVTRPLRGLSVRSMKRRGKVPIFILFYHRVSNEQLNDWTITVKKFAKQMKWLQKNFDVVDLEECQRRISSGYNDRPTVAITFDDGYSENGEFAIPYLVENRIPATYFVTTDNTLGQTPFPHDVQRNEPLATDDVDSLRLYASAGIEIGAHTRTHPSMSDVVEPEQIVDEVITSTRELEAAIGKKIRYFAFPFGKPVNMNPIVFHLLKECGFLGVCSAFGGWNEIDGDAFHLQRIHGDPVFARIGNALTYDPRVGRIPPYDYSIDPADEVMLERLKKTLELVKTKPQQAQLLLPEALNMLPAPIPTEKP